MTDCVATITAKAVEYVCAMARQRIALSSLSTASKDSVVTTDDGRRICRFSVSDDLAYGLCRIGFVLDSVNSALCEHNIKVVVDTTIDVAVRAYPPSDVAHVKRLSGPREGAVATTMSHAI